MSHAHPASVDRRFQLQCPRDNAPMEKFTYQGFHVDRCLSCGCMWFDPEELERVIGNPQAAAIIDADARVTLRRKELLKAKRSCPRDKARLFVREHDEQSHVEIDQCPSCRGILLDPGELRDLANTTMGERVAQLWRQALDWSGE
jgi:Zn-finger nucleic acid-binding protein